MTLSASLRAALAEVNGAHNALPPAAQGRLAIDDAGLDAELDAALLMGDRERALAAIRAWRSHWLAEFERADRESASERIEAKATQYLAAGRLKVQERAGRHVRATCAGSAAAPYELGYSPDEGWHCDCPAFRDCAHLHALRLVVASRSGGTP